MHEHTEVENMEGKQGTGREEKKRKRGEGYRRAEEWRDFVCCKNLESSAAPMS